MLMIELYFHEDSEYS